MVEQDRRRHPRVPVQIGVAYDNDVVLTEASINDISLGGASILTPAPLPVGSRLSLWFRGEEPNLDVKGQVVRVTEEDPDDETAHPGMAIRFTEISPSTESTLQQWIDWYIAQPAPSATPTQENPVLPRAEEASEQRYIQTQILPTIEAAPTPQAPIMVLSEPAPEPIYAETPSDATIQAAAIETPQDLESTQIESSPESEVNPFAAPTEANPFAPVETSPFVAPTEESLQTVRINLAELEAKRAARHIDPVNETIRMHPEELESLREASQEAHSDTTVTLPEMPAYNPDNDPEASPADSGERKSRRKKKK